MGEIATQQIYEELQGIRRELATLREQVQSIVLRLEDRTETRRPFRLAVSLEPDETDGFIVTSEVLPELVTEGDSREEAVKNALEATEDLLEVMLEDGDEMPGDLLGYRPGDSLEIVVSMPEAT